MSQMRTLYALVRFVPRLSRLASSGARSERKPRCGAACLTLTLCVSASATNAQTIPEDIDASDVAVAVPARGNTGTCVNSDGSGFNPYAPGCVFEGCRTPVLDQESCLASGAIATAGMVELAVCMANVRAGFPPQVVGQPNIHASAQENLVCGPGLTCASASIYGDHINWLIANGLTSNDCWKWDPTASGCPSTCPDSPSASFSDRYQVKNHRDFESDAEAMAYLENVGPIVAGMDIRDDFLSYSSLVYSFVSGDFLRGNHSVLIYGFGTVAGIDYWLCKNSFGDTWGESGYFKILRGLGNGVNMEFRTFRAAEGVACATMCGGICGQMRHSVCNGRGTCQADGVCACDAGFGGSLCERSVVCGDGLVDAGEECDDGDLVNDDGCSSTCTIEPDAQCSGEPSVCITGIPAVSAWSLGVLVLLLLSAGTVVMTRRKPAVAA